MFAHVDDNIEGIQYAPNSGITQFPSRYRILEGKIYFNPALASPANSIYKLIFSYPERLLADGQLIPSEFDIAMQHYIKYRTASILSARWKS